MHTSVLLPPTFGEHLQELRSRLLASMLALLAGSVVGYMLHDAILAFLVQPLNQTLFYSSPAGGFDFVFKLSLFFGFLIALPVFVFNFLRFIMPALPNSSVRLLLALFSASCVLLVLGVGFAYFVSLPAALYFLNAFATDQVQALITTDAYFTFVTRYLVGFGLLFQLPLVMVTINTFQRITVKTLVSYQRWVIVLSFLVAAFLTPTPDIVNQLLMAAPLILLYELSAIVVIVINLKRKSSTA